MLKSTISIVSMLSFALLTGCSSEKLCTPGQSVACACASGSMGAQVCQPGGTFGECSCGVSSGGDAGRLSDGGTTGGKRVFVTSASYRGDFAGSGAVDSSAVAAADMLCQRAAQGAILGGTWKAWISSGAITAINRIADVGPWYDLTGKKIFNNRDNLTTTPLSSFNIDERGQAQGTLNSEFTWTGTKAGGQSSSNCNAWSSLNVNGITGYVGSTTSTWTEATTNGCNNSAHLYCFEQ